MGKQAIQAIIFDIGGTLRVTQKKGERDLSYIRQLQSFLGETGDTKEFFLKLNRREREYRIWSRRTLIELPEAELWFRFMLPEYPVDFIQQNAITLNQMWREYHNKNLLPDAVSTMKILATRGYKLGIISNTTSSVEAPKVLREHGIYDLFSVIILSCVFGKRKPHPSLFLSASRQLGVPAEQCVYIGNSLLRDMIGARQAGFAEIGIINPNGYQLGVDNPDDDSVNNSIIEMEPDFIISTLSELLNRYTDSVQQPSMIIPPKKSEVLYDAALSTMWGVDQQMPFNDTFLAGKKLGFARFELNHKVSPDLYRQWDKKRFFIATVHDPCPALYTYDEMKREDILISSLDEPRRVKGVDILKKSIDLACRLGSLSVVVHPGGIMGDHSRDRRLRELYRMGKKGGDEYQNLAAELVAHRASLAAPHLDQVVKSMIEVIDYTRDTGVMIGLENRYRYYDIPLLNEMEVLLGLCKEDWYGFQYDVGHAQALDVLGLEDHIQWLERFSSRMIGVHLHDVIGIEDHQAPGKGDMDFKKIAPFIPVTALRTLEISPQASLTDLTNGLEVLADSGCIQRIEG